MQFANIGRKSPPAFARLLSPARVSRSLSGVQGILLWIKSPFLIHATQSSDAQPGARDASEYAHPEMRAHTVGELERHKCIIVHLRAGASHVYLCIDAPGQ